MPLNYALHSSPNIKHHDRHTIGCNNASRWCLVVVVFVAWERECKTRYWAKSLIKTGASEGECALLGVCGVCDEGVLISKHIAHTLSLLSLKFHWRSRTWRNNRYGACYCAPRGCWVATLHILSVREVAARLPPETDYQTSLLHLYSSYTIS